MSEKLKNESGAEGIDLAQQRAEELSLYNEAQELSDPEMKVSLYMRYAQRYMKKNWGIEDLTVEEGDELRDIIRRLLPKYEEDKKMVSKKEMRTVNFSEIEEEAPALWLSDLYGIHIKDIPTIHVITDETDGEKYKYEQTEMDVFVKKANELMDRGHRIYSTDIVDPAWKTYLRKLREKHPYGDFL